MNCLCVKGPPDFAVNKQFLVDKVASRFKHVLIIIQAIDSVYLFSAPYVCIKKLPCLCSPRLILWNPVASPQSMIIRQTYWISIIDWADVFCLFLSQSNLNAHELSLDLQLQFDSELFLASVEFMPIMQLYYLYILYKWLGTKIISRNVDKIDENLQ